VRVVNDKNADARPSAHEVVEEIKAMFVPHWNGHLATPALCFCARVRAKER